jgi:hypothetical protein
MATISLMLRRHWLILVGVGIYLLHLGLVWYACPGKVIWGGGPFLGLDYQTHFAQTRVLCESLQQFGQIWAYDPFLLSGIPTGLVFEVDNHAHGLFTCGLSSLGVDRALAFNLFVLLIHLLAPLAIWLAARLYRVGRASELASLALGVLVWHFDSMIHWTWQEGLISFIAVSCFSPLVVALFDRMLETPRLRFFLPVLILLPLLLLTHVWVFVNLCVPMIWLYLHRRKQLGPRTHLLVWLLVAAAIGGNLFWLIPVLEHLDVIALSGRVGQSNPIYLIADYLDLFINPINTGVVGTRTMVRFFAFATAVLSLWQWRKESDPRFKLGALSLGWLAGMCYFAAFVPGLRETEPTRFIIPTIFFAAVFAGPWVARLFSMEWLKQVQREARIVIGVLLLLAIPRLAHQVIYFIPELAPNPQGPLIHPNLGGAPALEPREFRKFRHDGVPEEYRKIAAYLSLHCKEPGRVLVEWWVLGEYLRWATDRLIVGGFPDRRMKHELANIFRYRKDPRFKGQALADYLVRYNIRYLVMFFPYPEVERRRDLFELKRFIGYHRVYRVRHLSNDFIEGSGVVRPSLNRLAVSEARPDPRSGRVVIKHHYLKTLRCSPGCRVERWPLPDNPVGFISVVGEPTLSSSFMIENRY